MKPVILYCPSRRGTRLFGGLMRDMFFMGETNIMARRLTSAHREAVLTCQNLVKIDDRVAWVTFRQVFQDIPLEAFQWICLLASDVLRCAFSQRICYLRGTYHYFADRPFKSHIDEHNAVRWCHKHASAVFSQYQEMGRLDSEVLKSLRVAGAETRFFMDWHTQDWATVFEDVTAFVEIPCHKTYAAVAACKEFSIPTPYPHIDYATFLQIVSGSFEYVL